MEQNVSPPKCFDMSSNQPARFVISNLHWCLQTNMFKRCACRRCVRRQSARFSSHEHEPKEENLFEIEDLKMHDDGSTTKSVEQKDGKIGSKPEPRESHRMSFGRPSRRAAEKIHSYKETPLNIKMRRPE